MEKSFAIPMSRRDFMKLAGLTAVGSVFGGASEQKKAEAGQRGGIPKSERSYASEG